ncbi:MAG: hypothetical protein M3430_18295 [Acidobacteriota bacterium]|nr:hypothetical protein [Acidobacteriota bacterium]
MGKAIKAEENSGKGLPKTDETMSTGSIIHWAERDKERVPITCGVCAVKRPVRIRRGERRLRFTGLCFDCSHPKHTEEETHHSGTIIHWAARDSTDPNNKNHRITITCHGCKRKSFNWAQSIRHPDWSGLCHNCIRHRVRPKKYFHDAVLPSGSIIHWGERDSSNSNRVAVTCGVCGRKRLIFRQAFHNIQQKWTGFCQGHTRVEVASHFLSLAREAQGQSNEKAKVAPVGAPKGSNALITESSLDHAFDHFDQLGEYASQELVAEFLDVTDRAIREWQRARGLNWRQVQKRRYQTGSELFDCSLPVLVETRVLR